MAVQIDGTGPKLTMVEGRPRRPMTPASAAVVAPQGIGDRPRLQTIANESFAVGFLPSLGKGGNARRPAVGAMPRLSGSRRQFRMN